MRTPRERRERLLDEFERSGASASAFAKLIGMKYQTFAYWVQRRREQGRPAGLGAAAVPRLLEAVVGGSQFAGRASVLRVELPGGARMELCDPSQAVLAAALLRELAQPFHGGTPC